MGSSSSFMRRIGEEPPGEFPRAASILNPINMWKKKLRQEIRNGFGGGEPGEAGGSYINLINMRMGNIRREIRNSFGGEKARGSGRLLYKSYQHADGEHKVGDFRRFGRGEARGSGRLYYKSYQYVGMEIGGKARAGFWGKKARKGIPGVSTEWKKRRRKGVKKGSSGIPEEPSHLFFSGSRGRG